MSIYATLYNFAVQRFGEDLHRCLYVQGVPAHIDNTGVEWEFLPPPIPHHGDDPDYDGPPEWRAVFIVEQGTPKGTERCGQEYEDFLLRLTGEQWSRLTFCE